MDRKGRVLYEFESKFGKGKFILGKTGLLENQL